MRKQKKKRKGRSRTARNPLHMERLETRVLLAADFQLMRNPVEPMDVNDDGEVSPLDALMIINEINGRRGGAGPPDAGDPAGGGRRGFVDVNGDRVVSPLDALMVINGINDRTRGRGGGGDGTGQRGGNDPVGDASEPAPIDGVGNNEQHPEWGSADAQLLRLTPVEYADGASSPAGEERASPREISNLVAAQTESETNDRGLTDLVWQWGQFLDHDIDLTGEVEPAESFPIAVPTGDPFFDPLATGEATIDLHRSDYDKDTGDSPDNPRQQLNAITAFIDGSNVYGSDDERALALRTLEGGRLKTSAGDLLPFNEDGLDNAGGPSDSLFLAGDVRANEQAGLAAMHTLWVREHNRIADEVAERHPELDDEAIYQRARSLVIAQMQAITFNEFLPALLGPDAVPEYRGYDPEVNPGISNVFSTAAYRFGHSMLSSELLRLDEDGQVVEAGNLSLRDAFFNPDALIDHGIDSLLRGLASQQAQEIDSQLVDDVRNFLFGPPGAGGSDLASLNIQRGRDHGLADYNDAREAFGLERVESFADITSDPALQSALEEAYGDVDSIDAWVGGLAEDHVAGGSVGELVQAVLVDQFTRLRDGDRFWHQNTFSGRELRQIESTTLADVIMRNTDIAELPDNVFFTAEQQPQGRDGDRGDRGPGRDDRGPRDRGPDSGGPDSGGPDSGGPEEGGPGDARPPLLAAGGAAPLPAPPAPAAGDAPDGERVGGANGEAPRTASPTAVADGGRPRRGGDPPPSGDEGESLTQPLDQTFAVAADRFFGELGAS